MTTPRSRCDAYGPRSIAQRRSRRLFRSPRSTRGVSDVVDQHRCRASARAAQAPAAASEPAWRRLGDASLTATVKSKLLADPDTSGLRIDVDTKDKVVTLTGKVKSQAEKGEAVQIAR